MRIIRETFGKYKQAHWKMVMDLYHERVLEVLPALSQKMDFKLPEKFILRPLATKGGKSKVNGRARFDGHEEYSIIMCLENSTIMNDYGVWVVDHECAHIACGIKYKNWSHDKVFTKTFIDAMLVPKKRPLLRSDEDPAITAVLGACITARRKE